jgi:hypothetical protein
MIRVGQGLRVLAIAIALAAAVDPACTLMRSDHPLISLVHEADDADSAALAGRAEKDLKRKYDVQRGAAAGAAATVVVGRRMPDPAPVPAGALITVIPPRASPRIEIERVQSPARASLSSRVPVRVSLRAIGFKGRTARIDLAASQLLLDRTTRPVAEDDERFEVTLYAAPAAPGLARFQVRAMAGENSTPAASADVGVEIDDHRWPVLVVDARPSWMSTYVRRALEADRRFDVTSRVATSTGFAVETGGAVRLSDPTALERFAAIVVGAPDGFSDADVRALEAFARRRGGAVVLLMDRVATGPFARLTGASDWSDVHGETRQTVSAELETFVATEFAAPQALIAGATVLAADRSASPPRTVVWQAPLGAGQVIVNGALDSWRYRVRDNDGFARFWTRAIAHAAESAPAALGLDIGEPVRSLGTEIPVRVVVRDVQLSDPDTPAPPVSVTAQLERQGADATSIRLWPESERGVFRGTARLPALGSYRVVAESAALRTTAEVFVGSVARAAEPDTGLAAWTTAHGGVVAAESALLDTLRERVVTTSRPQRVHPMRSLWWLAAFVFALGGEWWLRRVRGER